MSSPPVAETQAAAVTGAERLLHLAGVCPVSQTLTWLKVPRCLQTVQRLDKCLKCRTARNYGKYIYKPKKKTADT